MTNGLRNSPTGSEDPYIQILATTLVIASTGAMLTVGHEAPCRISALACRIESPDHTGKERNSRQVSGTSDASKTQLRLTGTYEDLREFAGFTGTLSSPAKYGLDGLISARWMD